MVVEKIRAFFTEYGLVNYGAYSYSEMTGKAYRGGFSQPKNGFLVRDLNSTKTPRYIVTDRFRQIVNTIPGMIMVIDESHAIKNKASARSAAVAALASAVLSSNYGYVALLSATPLDKEKHAIAYLRVLGMITEPKTSYRTPQGEFKLGSAAEAIGAAYKVDPQMTMGLLAAENAQITGIQPDGKVVVSGVYSDKIAKELMYQVFREVIYGKRFSRMIMPKKARVMNLFLFYDKRALETINSTVLRVIEATGFNPLTGMVAGKMKKGTNIGRYVKDMNDSLATRMPDYIVKHLTKYPTRKAVIFTKSVEAANWIALMLQNYRPLLQTGEVKQELRSQLLAAFQQPNANYRIFISTTTTGGIGIDLDDKDGNFPRSCFIFPDFSLIDHIQALGRVRRLSTKSEPWLFTVYPINYTGTKIQDIQTAMISKSDIIKDFTDGKEDVDLSVFGPDIKYPRDYEPEYEDLPPNDGKEYPPAIIPQQERMP